MTVKIPEYNFEFKHLTQSHIDSIESQLTSYIINNGGEIKYPLTFLDNIETYIREIDLGLYDIEVTYREDDSEILILHINNDIVYHNRINEIEKELIHYLTLKFIRAELENIKENEN